ncbi:unnamed protein product [Urochloa humidicola]
MGAGDGNITRHLPDGTTITCHGHGTCIQKTAPKPPPPTPTPTPLPLPLRRHVPAAPRQVSGAANYAVAGKLLLATAGAFAGVLLALVALHLYNASRRRRRVVAGRSRQRRLIRSLAIAGGGDDDDRDGGPAPSPRGLDPAVLAKIPIVMLDAGVVGDCAVCLAELEPGEKARALPRCGHRFHAECIDAWFRGNATCPLCRADVVVATVAPASAAAPSAPAEDGAALPEVRIDVAEDAAAAPNASVAPAMARMPSATTDRGKAREVFASARFAASF